MLLPYLSEVQNPSKKYTVAFKGLNYGEGTQDGEFQETHNLSTDRYPCITQRATRLKVKEYNSPTTLHAKGSLLVINDADEEKADVYYGDAKVGEVAPGKKQTATIGNYIVIFPDKKYYKVPTEENGVMQEGKFGSMEEIYTEQVGTSTGIKFTASTISKVTEYKGKNLRFTKTSINKANADFTKYFSVGDAVTITGCSEAENNKTTAIILRGVEKATLTFDEDTFKEDTSDSNEVTITRQEECNFPFKEGDAVTVEGCSEGGNNKKEEIIIREATKDKLTFDDNAFTEAIETGDVTIKRTVPDLDFICESNYRLWGTHGNTIYSSKFSDPFNFKVFDGLSSDSYAIEVGSEGEFTGCIPYSSHICFFKENTLHKLYGTKPSNFQITTVNVYGVQSGSERSMQIVNEQLLYKGVGGVYAYTGGVPELISGKFGNKRYSDAVACCDGEKYYISMKQGDMWDMFTYDVMKNLWLREDDTHAVDMTFYDGKVHYLDAKGGLYFIDKTAECNDIEWGATFCTIHETMNERKGYSKFHLRMDMDAGAWLAVDIKTDNDTEWRQIYTTHNEKAKTVSIPIIPTRCDSIDIRLRGKGRCTIKTFIREFTVGSDI